MGWQQFDVFANQVVVFGPNESILIYSGTPAFGNLIGSWAGQAGVDAEGNSYPAGLNVTVGVISGSTISGSTFEGTDFLINSSGLFFYGGTPALGNLIASVAATAGTDGKGNTYLPGTTSYINDSGNFFAVSSQGGGLVFASATSAGGAYTNYGQQGFDGAGNLLIETLGSAFLNIQAAILPMVLHGGATPGEVVGDGVLFATSTGDVESVSGSDGGIYGPMPAWKIFNGAQTISSTTGNDILGTSTPVSARKYHFFAFFLYTGGQAGGTANFALDVSAGATSPWIFGNFGNGATFGEGAQAGATGQVDSPTLTTGTWTAIMSGSFVSSAAGTFALHCQMSAAGDSVEILNGFMVLIPD